MSVPVQTDSAFGYESAELLFERDKSLFNPGTGRSYDIAPDGDRFLMVTTSLSGASSGAQVVVVQNWLSERNQ